MRQAIQSVQRDRPFDIVAIVLLPDHWHTGHRQRGVWHKRYWEHTVRDEDDLQRCVDYIHWNPRKHKLVTRVRDWKWSSFHRYVRAGEYDIEWGGKDPTPGWDDPEWGELT